MIARLLADEAKFKITNLPIAGRSNACSKLGGEYGIEGSCRERAMDNGLGYDG